MAESRPRFGDTLVSSLPANPVGELFWILRGHPGRIFNMVDAATATRQASNSESDLSSGRGSDRAVFDDYSDSLQKQHFRQLVVLNLGYLNQFNLFLDELEMLKQFARLATKLQHILAFIDKFHLDPGTYCRTVALRVQDCLVTFNDLLDECYENHLDHPNQPLCTYSRLLTFDQLFDILIKLINILWQEDNITPDTKTLLDFISELNLSGWKEARNFMKEFNGCAAMYHQDLWNWLVFGVQPFSPDEQDRFLIKDGGKLDVANMPTHFSLRLIDKIIFTGQYVAHSGDQLIDQPSEMAATYQTFVGHTTEQTGTHPLSEFEAFLEQLKRIAAAKSFHFIVQNHDLFDHLARIKSVLLVGREELFTDWVARLIQKSQDLNGLLSAYHSKVLLKRSADEIIRTEPDIEELFTSFDFTFPEKCKIYEHSCVTVTYKLPDALKKIIKPEAVLQVYNDYLNLVLDILKARFVLGSVWRTSTKEGNTLSTVGHLGNSGGVLPSLWTIRHRLSIILERFYYFIKVNVCETLYQKMIQDMEKCQDYEAIQSLHNKFISRLQLESLIGIKPVRKAIYDLIDLVYRLPGLQLATGVQPMSGVDQLIEEFDAACTRFRVLLVNLKTHQISPSLRFLLVQVSDCLQTESIDY